MVIPSRWVDAKTSERSRKIVASFRHQPGPVLWQLNYVLAVEERRLALTLLLHQTFMVRFDGNGAGPNHETNWATQQARRAWRRHRGGGRACDQTVVSG